MASNKKWIIGGSITLLLLLGASIGTGAWIGFANKAEDNYINIYLGDSEYKGQLDLGTDITTDEEKAMLLEEQFYAQALFKSNSSIFNNENPSDLDWNLPFISTNGMDSTTLLNEFIQVKFLSETENTSVYSFLSGMSSTVEDQAKLMLTISTLLMESDIANIPFPAVTGLDIISNDAFVNTRDLIFELLSTDSSYIRDVEKDILVYTYLWQEPAQKSYDYILTRELVYSSPSIVYSMKLDGEEADLNTISYPAIANATEATAQIDADTWNGYISDFKGEVLVDDTIDQDVLVDGGMQGYQGIKFGTSAGTNVSSDWVNWDNTWIPDDEAVLNTASTETGAYSHEDVLNSANLYIADPENGSDGEGAAIFDTSSDSTDPEFGNRVGERTVYAYSQLYPYMFREVENEGLNLTPEEILGNEQFSLFAHNEAGVYSPVASDADLSTETYIFDEWFGAEATYGEIYVSEAIVGNNSSLVNNALRYWNNKGFYIELSGTYEDDLASYLPSEILYNE